MKGEKQKKTRALIRRNPKKGLLAPVYFKISKLDKKGQKEQVETVAITCLGSRTCALILGVVRTFHQELVSMLEQEIMEDNTANNSPMRNTSRAGVTIRGIGIITEGIDGMSLGQAMQWGQVIMALLVKQTMHMDMTTSMGIMINIINILGTMYFHNLKTSSPVMVFLTVINLIIMTLGWPMQEVRDQVVTPSNQLKQGHLTDKCSGAKRVNSTGGIQMGQVLCRPVHWLTSSGIRVTSAWFVARRLGSPQQCGAAAAAIISSISDASSGGQHPLQLLFKVCSTHCTLLYPMNHCTLVVTSAFVG